MWKVDAADDADNIVGAGKNDIYVSLWDKMCKHGKERPMIKLSTLSFFVELSTWVDYEKEYVRTIDVS